MHCQISANLIFPKSLQPYFLSPSHKPLFIGFCPYRTGRTESGSKLTHKRVLIWIEEITHVRLCGPLHWKSWSERMSEREGQKSCCCMEMLVKYIIPAWQCNSLICAPPARHPRGCWKTGPGEDRRFGSLTLLCVWVCGCMYMCLCVVGGGWVLGEWIQGSFEVECGVVQWKRALAAAGSGQIANKTIRLH